MATDSILKKGYLYQFRNKQEVYGWERLYFVLHGHSSKNEARLDWYESLESSESNPGLRSGVFVEEITRVERISYQSNMEYMYGPSANFLFGIHTFRKEEPYVIKCADVRMLTDWMKQLSNLLREVRQLKRTNRKKPKIAETVYSMHNTPESLTFARDVEVEETAAAERQSIRGRFRFVLSRQHLSLTNPSDASTALFWHYSHVRRFGYSDRTFTIEGGQRSGPGEGLFILKNCEGRALFNEVQEKIRLLRQSTDEGQGPSSSSAVDAWSKDGDASPGSPIPTEMQGDDDDQINGSILLDRQTVLPYPRGGNPLASNTILEGAALVEPAFSAGGGGATGENAHQQSDSEDDDDDDEDSSCDDDETDGRSTPRNKKKPKIPPKNFDLRSLAMTEGVDSKSGIDSKSSNPSAAGKKNADKAKTKGRQSKADKALSRSSLIRFGPFRRFASPPPSPPAPPTAVRSRNDGRSDRQPLVNCRDEGFHSSPKDKEQTEDAGRGGRSAATGAAMSLDWKREEGRDATPPPVKPKNFRRGATVKSDENPIIVVPSLPSRTKPASKEKCHPKGRKTSSEKPMRHSPATPRKPVSNSPRDPRRYVGSDAMTLQNVKVVETPPVVEDVRTFVPLGPKISEVLLHLGSCQISESGSLGGTSSKSADHSAKAPPEDEYNRIDLRADAAAGKARASHHVDVGEHHLYGQSLICQFTQSVEDEPCYEDIDREEKPPKNTKKTKK